MAETPSSSGTSPTSTYQRLYLAFAKYRAQQCGNCPHKDVTQQSILYRTSSIAQRQGVFSKLTHIFLPSVYAAEATEQETLTITQKVTTSRPKIHISEDEIEKYLAAETGKDRLREMFSQQAGDTLSPEMDLVVNVSERCALISFILASFFGSIEARDKFIEDNKHTKFTTRLRASRLFYDAILLGGIKNGVLWAVKSGVFTAVFLGASQGVSVYRNKSNPMDYVAGAALTGGLFKLNLGPKGFIAGSIIGGVLGLIGGTAVYGLMRMTNETQEERRYWVIQARLQAQREAQLMQANAMGEITEVQPSTEAVS